jgi:hypothetical protein
VLSDGNRWSHRSGRPSATVSSGDFSSTAFGNSA